MKIYKMRIPAAPDSISKGYVFHFGTVMKKVEIADMYMFICPDQGFTVEQLQGISGEPLKEVSVDELEASEKCWEPRG